MEYYDIDHWLSYQQAVDSEKEIYYRCKTQASYKMESARKYRALQKQYQPDSFPQPNASPAVETKITTPKPNKQTNSPQVPTVHKPPKKGFGSAPQRSKDSTDKPKTTLKLLNAFG
jgi:hypothetical protein